MAKALPWLAAVTLLCGTTRAEPPDTDRANPSPFAQFVGVVQGGPSTDQAELWKHITFARHDLSWGALQPTGRDEWNQKYLDDWGKMVLESREHGVEVLPILDYMVDWAARRRAWSFSVGDVRYDVAAAEGIESRKAVAVNLKTGEKQETDFSPGRLPPEDVKDWENYVERVVGFLSKPPYNVKYFQPWNEAHDQFTGFWAGGLDEFITTIHLPAARIIRAHGAKVVYGGYPCCGTMKRFIEVCDRHNAWDTLDVISTHYFPLSAWEYLHDNTIKPGKVWGLWQTEVGFTSDTGWIPNNFPRFFHWALRHDWEPDRYRLFHFAYWSPNDPKAYGYKCGLMLGNEPSHHGRALMTLGNLLNSPSITPFTDWRSEPVLHTETSEQHSSIEAFDTGTSIVLAVHLLKENTAAIFTDRNGDGDNLHLDWPTTTMRLWLPSTAPDTVKSAERVGIYGSRLPLEIEPDAKGIVLHVNVTDADGDERRDNRATTVTTFYVEVTRK